MLVYSNVRAHGGSQAAIGEYTCPTNKQNYVYTAAGRVFRIHNKGLNCIWAEL